MRQINIRQLFCLSLVICAILYGGFSARAETLRAGAAVVDISPDNVVGVKLGGYGDRKQTSDGLHDPITARCAVIDDGKTKIALVTTDLIGLFYEDIIKMEKAAGEKIGITPENILIHAIHTHSAPDTLGVWGGPPKGYKQKVSDGVSACVTAAATGLRPATASFGTGNSAGHNINRRHPKDRKADETMSVMEMRDEAGKTIFTLMNFACHPVVLGGDNLKITADYVYFARDRIEKARGGTALFFTRDIGDANPPAIKPDDVYSRAGGTFEMAEKLGYAIADDAITIINNSNSQPINITIISRQLNVPIENRQLLGYMRAGLIKRQVKNGATRTAVAVVDFGPAQIMTFPGEATSSMREMVEGLLPGPVKFFFGQTLDEPGYIVPQSEWSNSTYEETVSLGKSYAETLKNAYTEIAREMFSKQPLQ